MPLPSVTKVFSVTEVANQIHELLEASLPELWVEGEISNCKTYPSGHTYMTLKDETAQLKAVLWKGNAWSLRFKPCDGLKVLVRARVSSYVARGDLQLIISAMEPREKGGLQLAFEQLKAKLESEGLFSAQRKRPLPRYPRVVGIVSSLQGAALRDMLNVLARRSPGLEILISPVCVQGDGAKEDIARAIGEFNRHFPETDLLLVGRGGGSIEDLWAFNEELVARAIAGSKIPIISCVGHETDTTIADFVADLRAPTPSAAAELAVPDRRAVLEGLRVVEDELYQSIDDLIQRLSDRLQRLASHPFLQSPHRMYEERIRRVDELSMRLPDAMQSALRRAERELAVPAQRLPDAVRGVLRHSEKDLALQAEKLQAFSPLKVLSRGYAIAQKPDGRVVRSSKEVRPGDRLRVRVRDGQISCEVTDDKAH